MVHCLHGGRRGLLSHREVNFVDADQFRRQYASGRSAAGTVSRADNSRGIRTPSGYLTCTATCPSIATKSGRARWRQPERAASGSWAHPGDGFGVDVIFSFAPDNLNIRDGFRVVLEISSDAVGAGQSASGALDP
jgi:hypothetical protein